MGVQDDFQGVSWISLQANDSKVPFSFPFSICSSATANDGSLPYGTNISSVTVAAYNSAGTAVTSTMISGTPTESTNTVTVKLNWPGAVDIYKLTFVVTLDNADATKMEFDFKRVKGIAG